MNTTDPDLTAAQQRVAVAETRAERLKRIIIVVAAFLGIVIVATVVGGVVLIRTTQQQGSPAVKQIISQGKEQKALLHTIKSCTDPTGACFKDGQKRTADAVGSINEITIYAVVCGQQHPGAGVAVIGPCVTKLYAANHKP